MAQTKRKRRTKHRGNAAGMVESRGRTSRPAPGSERKGAPAKRGAQGRRALKPATIQRAVIKAAGFAVLLFVLTQVGIFGRSGQGVAGGAVLAAVSFLLYTPLVYATDRWAYSRDQRRLANASGRR
jgi:hypothetical protein